MVPTCGECFREQRLLELRAANPMAVVFPGKNRKIFETDKTYLHGCSLCPQLLSSGDWSRAVADAFLVVVATVRGAEPSMQRAAMDRRVAA